MGLKDHSINVFEKRVEALLKFTDPRELPQWTANDVVDAHCLINQLKKYKNATNKALDADLA